METIARGKCIVGRRGQGHCSGCQERNSGNKNKSGPVKGNVIECEAVVDTGSVLAFLSLEEVQSCAPALLKRVRPDSVHVTGISGEDVKVQGVITLYSNMEIWDTLFIVADRVEPVLLGLDFMRSHLATWDWLSRELVYQKESLTSDKHTCRLTSREELPPSTINCYPGRDIWGFRG